MRMTDCDAENNDELEALPDNGSALHDECVLIGFCRSPEELDLYVS